MGIEKELCDAMADAGVTNPESQSGIDFCTSKCPYDHCVVMEPMITSQNLVRITNIRWAKELRTQGMLIKDIAIRIGVTPHTISTYLRL